MEKVRIIIVDRQAIFREALAHALGAIDGISVVDHCPMAEDVLNQTAAKDFDVMLSDIMLPGIDGITFTRLLKGLKPAVKTIIITAQQDPEHIIDAFEAGAAGYLGRDATLEELVLTITRVMKGETAVFPRLSETILGQYARVKKSRERRNTLKEEHISILRYAGKGLSNKEIAEKLDVTIDSVKSRLKSIFSKLSAKDRTHAVSEAIRLGLISMD